MQHKNEESQKFGRAMCIADPKEGGGVSFANKN